MKIHVTHVNTLPKPLIYSTENAGDESELNYQINPLVDYKFLLLLEVPVYN